MESVCVRLDDRLAKKIDSCMRSGNYSTKTDFIREAIRVKVTDFEKEQLRQKQWEKLASLKGSVKPSGKDFLKERMKVDAFFRELAENGKLKDYLK
jgi:Arc/MetJ-type ribon-helix-helix transcriptional regulator